MREKATITELRSYHPVLLVIVGKRSFLYLIFCMFLYKNTATESQNEKSFLMAGFQFFNGEKPYKG